MIVRNIKLLVSDMNAIVKRIRNGQINKTKCEQYQKPMPFCVQCKALIGNRRFKDIETTFVAYTGSQSNLLNKEKLVFN